MTHPLLVDGELILYGFVGGSADGDSFFLPQGFAARDVIDAVSSLDGDFNVRINSPGGFAEEGVAIYRALRLYSRGKITMKVDAIAASAASIIAMAGSTIIVPEAALLMIHDASGITMGTSEDHLKTAEILEKLDSQMAAIYAGRTGLSPEECKALMDAETWLDGKEAVEKGFADEAPSQAPESEPEPAAFDYRIYAHAPERLKARAAKRALAPAPAAAQQEETGMTSKTTPAETPVKPTTAADLTAAFPELVNDITASASAAAAKAERERINGIDAIAMATDDAALIAEMKADGKTTPADAALRLRASDKAKGEKQLQALRDADRDAAAVRPAPTAPGNPAQPAKKEPSAQTDAELEAEWNSDPKIKGEFLSAKSYVAFVRAEASGKVRILHGHEDKKAS